MINVKKIFGLALTFCVLLPSVFADTSDDVVSPDEYYAGILSNPSSEADFGEEVPSEGEEYPGYDYEPELGDFDEDGGKPAKKAKAQKLNDSRRIFEFRVEVPLGLSNNAMGITDIFVKELVIDLPKIYKDLPRKGLVFNVNSTPNIQFNLNTTKFAVGLHGGVDLFANFGIDSGLFKFLGEGNKLNEKISAGVNLNSDAFIFLDVPVKFKPIEKLVVSTVPTLFVPVYHLNVSGLEVSITNKDDGSLAVGMNGNADLYTMVPFSGSLDFSRLNVGGGMGFDITIGATYALFSFLNVGGSFHFPVAPGYLMYKRSASVEYDYTLSVMGAMNGDMDIGTPSINFDQDSVEEKYLINRPIRLMAEASYKPFGNFLNVFAQLGFAVRYAGIKNEGYAFMEYNLGGSVRLFNTLGATVATSYLDEVFAHSISLLFDCRVFELDVTVKTESASFAKTFTGAGFGFNVGFAFGF